MGWQPLSKSCIGYYHPNARGSHMPHRPSSRIYLVRLADPREASVQERSEQLPRLPSAFTEELHHRNAE